MGGGSFFRVLFRAWPGLPLYPACQRPLPDPLPPPARPGERLFPLVSKLQPDLAGKITGMLLEMDNAELLMLLDSNEALVGKVDEAIQVQGGGGIGVWRGRAWA